MGGFGSGRYGGRPLTGQCLYLELGWMLKTGRAKDGAHIDNVLSWHCGGEESGSVRCSARMDQPECERLELSWRLISTGEQVRQTIDLDYTEPNYGGKRWWLVCPYQGTRANKLYLPSGGSKFASRQAYRLGYRSQRLTPADQTFERLFRLQRKLGSPEGWGGILLRPKGMWRRTYDRHFEQWMDLEDDCNRVAAAIMGLDMNRGG